MIHSHVTTDGALGGGRLSAGDAGGWLNPLVSRARAALGMGRGLVAALRDSSLQRGPGRGAARIRVSGMSDRWLRTHEIEYDKHRPEP